MERRYGKFYLDSNMVRQGNKDDEKLLLKLFSNMIIVRCEHDFASNEFEYIAISPLFEVIPPEIVIPTYRISFNEITNDAGKLIDYEIKAEKIS